MKLVPIYSTLCMVVLCSFCDGYRILGIFPYNAKSQNIVFEALMNGLVKHGHQVDVISHYPNKNLKNNYNHIVSLEGSMERSMNNFSMEYISVINDDVISNVAEHYGNRLCHFLGVDKIQTLIKSPPKDPPYDLVITGTMGAHCYFGLGYVFNVPVVALWTETEFPWSHWSGSDDNLAYVPNYFYAGTEQMNFFERMKNVVSNFIAVYRFERLTEIQTDLMRKYLGPNIPSIREVEKNVALTLVNSHLVLFGVKPIAPSLVQIAGLHIEANNQTLPEDLQNWMDESANGVVYFSFGSMVLIETLPPSTLQEILASFKKVSPVRVLVKIFNSTKLPPGLPDNVKTLPWIPQQAVLAHPNTKVFITHGGLGGVQEALYYGVPMIGIPLFGDQFRNVQFFVNKGMMMKIDFNQLSEKSFDEALKVLLHNPTYKEKAIYYSKLFRDDPMCPMDKAAFWIEFVIRNGPEALKSPALQLSFVQLTLLDVYFALLLILLCILFVSYWSMKVIVKLLLKNREDKSSTNSAKKIQ